MSILLSVRLTSNLRTYLRQKRIGPFDVWPRRSIYVVRSRPPSRLKTDAGEKRNKKIEDLKKLYETRRSKEKEDGYKKKLAEIKALTSKVSELIRIKDKEETEDRRQMYTGKNDKHATTLKNSEKIYRGLSSGTLNSSTNSDVDVRKDPPKLSPLSFVTLAVEIPEVIKQRLGLSIKYLVSSKNQNWPLVLHELQKSGGFNGIPTKDVRRLLYVIPKAQISGLVPLLESMLNDAQIPISSKIAKVFMLGLASGSVVTEDQVRRIEEYHEYLKVKTSANPYSTDVYEILLKAYGKNNNLDKLNACLSDMKERKIQFNELILSEVLATCIYKAKDHKQAVEIFDSMKFLSQETEPNTRAYQDIIVSHVNNDNIEKALDLYLEMQTNGVSLNQKILVALARGCVSRQELKYKAWDFIFEIYEKGWEPSLQTMEYILYICAKDGDVPLARAIFLKLYRAKAISPKSFSFLLLSYSRCHIFYPGEIIEAPIVTFHEKGKIFRNSLLNSFISDIGKDDIPFLPALELATEKEILAESNAIWLHFLLQYPHVINTDSCNTYLNIAANSGSIQEFIDRFESSTYLDRSGLQAVDNTVKNEPQVIELENAEDDEISINFKSLDNPASSRFKPKSSISQTILAHSISSNKKVARTSLTYVIALKLAARFKNYSFAKDVWTERGIFRKTDAFKNLPMSVKDKLDFQFASAMVSGLARMSLLDDAMALLLSTEYQFKWTWSELNELYRAAATVGREDVCKTVRGISKRAQVNFEGKIRRKDFKRYVAQRGY